MNMYDLVCMLLPIVFFLGCFLGFNVKLIKVVFEKESINEYEG